MTGSQIVLVVSVAVYMAVMLAIGFWASGKIHNTRDYIVAGGRLGGWLSLGTLFATWFGAETCMGSSRTAYEQGILGVIADPFGAGLCLILSGLFFVRFFRRFGFTTIIHFFEARYGKKTASIFGLLYVPVYLGWVGGQLLAFGLILHSLTGLPVSVAVATATAVVLLYTYSGGMWAVAATDLVQMFFIILGLGILFPVLLSDLGGWQTARAQIPDHFFHFYPREGGALAWLSYAQAWMIVGIGSLPAQDLFQRIMAPRNETIARWSAVLAGLLYMIIGMIPVLLGILGRIVLPENAGDSILLALSEKYLSLPLRALMVGALLSAIMSTADSALLAPAGIIGNNLAAYFHPQYDDAARLRWCKASIPIVGLASLFLAICFKNVYTLCTQSWGILLVGVSAPMIAGMFWKRASTAGALAALVSGILAWIVFSNILPSTYPSQLMAFAVSWIALMAVSIAVPQKQKALSY
ncbi:MAG: sodium:solute symporter family protein [Candidatus Omnitrophota bacterium]